jgi:CubicO group peptidase (beta-lactamase class C family)
MLPFAHRCNLLNALDVRTQYIGNLIFIGGYMKRIRLAAVLITIFYVSLFGQQNNPVVPESELGEIVRNFVSAVNAPDPEVVKTFVNNHLRSELSGVGGDKWNTVKYTELLMNLRKQGGIISPVQVQPGYSDDYMAVMFQLSESEKIAAIEFVKNKNNKSLRSLEVHAMQKPSAPYQWPAEKLNKNKIIDALDEKLNKDINSDLFSGVVLIANEDGIIFNKAYGYASKKDQVKNDVNTRFHTGSVGKMITAAAIVQLVERGKLKFSDTIGSVLKNYPNKYAAGKVTIEHLLTHTSGIADPFEAGRREPGVHYVTPGDNLPLFADIELNMEPGTRHSYSNGNYTVLGAVIEEISGLTLEEYFRKNIFKPAGMSVADPESYNELGIAVRYSHPSDNDPLALNQPEPVANPGNELTFEYSGFCSGYLTAEDIYKFLKALREGVIVSEGMVEILTTGKVAVAETGPAKYAYGFYDVTMWGVNMRGHSGGGSRSGIGADAEMLWDNNYYVIVLGNYDLDKVRPVSFSICRFLGNQN